MTREKISKASKHKLLVVPRVIDDISFDALENEWNAATSTELVLPPRMSRREINAMAGYLMTKIPAKFAYDILELIAEDAPLSESLINQIFEVGDTACKVSVCLRPRLSVALAEKCQKSPDPEVRQHYLARMISKKKRGKPRKSASRSGQG